MCGWCADQDFQIGKNIVVSSKDVNIIKWWYDYYYLKTLSEYDIRALKSLTGIYGIQCFDYFYDKRDDDFYAIVKTFEDLLFYTSYTVNSKFGMNFSFLKILIPILENILMIKIIDEGVINNISCKKKKYNTNRNYDDYILIEYYSQDSFEKDISRKIRYFKVSWLYIKKLFLYLEKNVKTDIIFL